MARPPAVVMKGQVPNPVTHRRKPAASVWALGLVFVLIVLAIGARYEELRASGGRAVANVAYMRASMASGYALRAPSAPPRVVNLEGVQARAAAHLAAAAGDMGAVEQYLDSAVAAAPDDWLSRFVLCRFYAGDGRWEEARRTCAGDAVSVRYWLLMGVRARDAGQLNLALENFRAATTVDPNNSQTWLQRARVAFDEGQYAEAITAFERVMDLDAGQPFEVFNSLGTAYLSAGDATNARATAERGLLMYPNRRELYLIVGESMRRQDDLAAADDWYRQWLERWPDDTFAWAQRGEIALRRGRPDAAVSYFQRATELEPQTGGYWLNLARAAAEAGDTAVATAAYETTLRLMPGDVEVWLAAGRYMLQIGQSERARTAYEYVLTLEPGNSEAAAALAKMAEAGAP